MTSCDVAYQICGHPKVQRKDIFKEIGSMTKTTRAIVSDPFHSAVESHATKHAVASIHFLEKGTTKKGLKDLERQ